MQTLLSSVAVDWSVEWKFWQIRRGFRFWEAFVKSLGGRANQRSGDHQKLDWSLIVRPFAFEELRLRFIHTPPISFLHLLRSWAVHVKEWVENTWVRSLEVEPIFVCGGWKMNAAQCVAGVQRLHSSGAGKAHLTSVLRCNFTAMQTDQFRTKAQQSFKLQQTTGITQCLSQRLKKVRQLLCVQSLVV